MFHVLGKTVARIWPVLLVAWVAVVVGLHFVAPDWDDVAKDGEFAYMPDEYPSRRADQLFRDAFPDHPAGSSVVLVLSRSAGLQPHDRQFIRNVLEPRLRQLAEEQGGLADAQDEPASNPEETTPAPPGERHSIISRIRTPDDAGVGRLLISEANRAALVVIELTTEFLEIRNWPTIERIEDLLAELRREEYAAGEQGMPPGLEVALTGSAVAGRDRQRARAESAEATEFWTILLVVVLLVLIYRAPLLALIPLITVYVAVKVSLHLLALMAQAGIIGIFEGVQVYTTVLVYGAGVDYCLFLIARYHEELSEEANFTQGMCRALHWVGAAIAASAGTVMFGIGMMYFAQFGKFQQAGVAIAFSLFVALCAVLTFSSSLLCMTGRWAFWPRPTRPADMRGWGWIPVTHRLSRFLEPNPMRQTWERIGNLVGRRPGTVLFVSFLFMTPFAVIAVRYYNTLDYDLFSGLPKTAPSATGTERLLEHFPAGITGTTDVLINAPDSDFSTSEGINAVQALTDRLMERAEELRIADIRSVAEPLGNTVDVDETLADLPAPQRLVQRRVMRRRAIDRYVSHSERFPGNVTAVELVLAIDPFARESIRHLDVLEAAVREELPPELANAELHFSGPTASIRDLKDVANSDRVRINVLVVLAVYAILVALLGMPGISLYLIITVLFGYLVTLGVAFTVFWALDPRGFAGLDWTLPIFVFTILVAVGEDYNIFLVTRVVEEQERHGPIHGIKLALTKTGSIISSCGIIMAGTFSSLAIGGRLDSMVQMGFALAFGVLLDTFIVRPILVPAFLILISRPREKRPETQL